MQNQNINAKLNYANCLLPKLKWAASKDCTNLDYAQLRLQNAIICIEDLIDIIIKSKKEAENNES